LIWSARTISTSGAMPCSAQKSSISWGWAIPPILEPANERRFSNSVTATGSECFSPVRFVPDLVPFFAAPAVCWWARTVVESMLAMSSSPLAASMRSRSAIRCQVPSMRQRRWRPAAVSQGP
jgi:hypothetical protein